MAVSPGKRRRSEVEEINTTAHDDFQSESKRMKRTDNSLFASVTSLTGFQNLQTFIQNPQDMMQQASDLLARRFASDSVVDVGSPRSPGLRRRRHNNIDDISTGKSPSVSPRIKKSTSEGGIKSLLERSESIQLVNTVASTQGESEPYRRGYDVSHYDLDNEELNPEITLSSYQKATASQKIKASVKFLLWEGSVSLLLFGIILASLSQLIVVLPFLLLTTSVAALFDFLFRPSNTWWDTIKYVFVLLGTLSLFLISLYVYIIYS